MKKLKKIVSKVFKLNPNKINETSSSRDIKRWDSFNHLLLIVELGNCYHVKFTIGEVLSIKNVSDIKNILIEHGAKIDD